MYQRVTIVCSTGIVLFCSTKKSKMNLLCSTEVRFCTTNIQSDEPHIFCSMKDLFFSIVVSIMLYCTILPNSTPGLLLGRVFKKLNFGATVVGQLNAKLI